VFGVEVKKALNIASAPQNASCCGAYVQEELCFYLLPPRRNKGKHIEDLDGIEERSVPVALALVCSVAYRCRRMLEDDIKMNQ
jgi:hypothetical protein